jgi:hypothetical protein
LIEIGQYKQWIKTVKAIDLVESIKPDKFMMDLERQNVKIEALKQILKAMKQ